MGKGLLELVTIIPMDQWEYTQVKPIHRELISTPPLPATVYKLDLDWDLV